MLVEDVELYAVASINNDNAKAIVSTLKVAKFYEDYKILKSDEKVDIIYIATSRDTEATFYTII